jgi:hypothetical protein
MWFVGQLACLGRVCFFHFPSAFLRFITLECCIFSLRRFEEHSTQIPSVTLSCSVAP